MMHSHNPSTKFLMIFLFCFNLCFLLTHALDRPLSRLQTNTSSANSTSKEDVLELEKPLTIEIAQNSEKEFAYKYDSKAFQIISIAIKDLNEPNGKNDIEFKPDLSEFSGSCFKSNFHNSWLCYLSDRADTLKFSLYNPNKTSFYNISISKTTTQRVFYDTETRLSTSIPGFGSFIKINLPLIGVLTVKARTPDDKCLSIIEAPSFEGLFMPFLSLNMIRQESTDNQGLTIQNKQPNTEWYFYVQQENDEESFVVSSYFIEQATLEVEEQAIYYINPELYQYQHIKLNVEALKAPQKYKATIRTQGSKSLMNLYFDFNPYGLDYVGFPNQNIYDKRASPVTGKERQLSLLFTVSAVDISVYLSIQALEKGFYTIEVHKVESRNIWENILIVLLVACVLGYMFICLIRIFTLGKPNQCNGILPTLRSDPESQVSLSTADNEQGDVREFQHEFAILIRKLENQDKEEALKRLNTKMNTQKDFRENDKDKGEEEKRCDICYEAKETVIFGPCGHKCACDFCALIIIQTSGKCPLCRKEINQVNDLNRSYSMD